METYPLELLEFHPGVFSQPLCGDRRSCSPSQCQLCLLCLWAGQGWVFSSLHSEAALHCWILTLHVYSSSVFLDCVNSSKYLWISTPLCHSRIITALSPVTVGVLKMFMWLSLQEASVTAETMTLVPGIAAKTLAVLDLILEAFSNLNNSVTLNFTALQGKEITPLP